MIKSATEQYYEGLIREKNRKAWTDVSKQIGEVSAVLVPAGMFKDDEKKVEDETRLREEHEKMENEIAVARA